MKITITRVEGPINLCEKSIVVETFKDANTWLRAWSNTFPKQGYDKHDFTIKFDDKTDYSGRLDCKHYSCEDNDLDLKQHVIDFCNWITGYAKNPYCGKKEYYKLVKNYSEQDKKKCLTVRKLIAEKE